MDAVAQLVELLQGHPDLKLDVFGGTVTVEPRTDDGFTVSLTEGAGEWVVTFGGVGFDGWHKRFTSEDAALDWFAFGLSDGCRLRVRYRGRCPYSWTLEEWTEGEWRAVGTTTSRMLFPPWRRPRDEYHQNTIFSAAEPGEAPGT